MANEVREPSNVRPLPKRAIEAAQPYSEKGNVMDEICTNCQQPKSRHVIVKADTQPGPEIWPTTVRVLLCPNSFFPDLKMVVS